MRDFEAPAAVASVCPICQSHLDEGAPFCARCGTFLRGDGASPEAINLPVVHLLSQVCALQRELLRQFRTGRALQARQFERALRVQGEELQHTLAHAAHQTESQERRLRLWLRWTGALAAAFAAVVVIAAQLAG